MSKLGIDYFSNQAPGFYPCVRGLGVEVILRYYSWTPAKNLDAAQAQAMLDAGIGIIPVWETTGGAPGYVPSGNAYFTAAQGQQDAVGAVRDAVEAGQPTGTLIFLAIDNPAVSLAATGSYWDEAYAVLAASGYLLGLYGFQSHVRAVQAGQAAGAWLGIKALWQTYGNDPGPGVIWQYQQTTYCGVDVDLNRVPDGFPLWDTGQMTDDEFKEKFERLYRAEFRGTDEAEKALETKIVVTLRKVRDAISEVINQL